MTSYISIELDTTSGIFIAIGFILIKLFAVIFIIIKSIACILAKLLVGIFNVILMLITNLAKFVGFIFSKLLIGKH